MQIMQVPTVESNFDTAAQKIYYIRYLHSFTFWACSQLTVSATVKKDKYWISINTVNRNIDIFPCAWNTYSIGENKSETTKWEPGRKVILCCSHRPVTDRFDVAVQEADGVDALYGFQDLATQPQGGADAERAAGHAPPQVGQITTLERRWTRSVSPRGLGRNPANVIKNKKTATKIQMDLV